MQVRYYQLCTRWHNRMSKYLPRKMTFCYPHDISIQEVFFWNNPTRQYALGIFRLKADSRATAAVPVCKEMKLICCSSMHSTKHHFPSMQTMKVPVHKIPHYYPLCVAELVNLSLLEWKNGGSFVAFRADDAGKSDCCAGRPVTFFVMSPIWDKFLPVLTQLLRVYFVFCCLKWHLLLAKFLT